MKITVRSLQKKILIRPKEVKRTVRKILYSERKGSSIGEISICYISDKRIKGLNRRFLGKDASTDVISFSMPDQRNRKKVVADIAISVDTAIRNAVRFKVACRRELKLYLIHGVLHLLGYDDSTPRKKQRMRKQESKYLNIRHYQKR